MGSLKDRVRDVLNEIAEDERIGIRAGELMWYVDGGRSKYYEVVRVLEDFGVLERIRRGLYKINWLRAVQIADTPAIRKMAERTTQNLKMEVRAHLQQISQAEVIG